MPKPMTGTREWASSNVNICQGCANDCRYCYAREIAVNRFHRKTVANWHVEEIDEKKVDKGFGFRKGVVMFPTTHDITAGTVDACCTVLRKLADAGNRVLVVSKPRPDCIMKVVAALSGHQERVEFRFTIGAMDDAILGYWEPNAPMFLDRVQCLVMATGAGFTTSVSIEPMLDAPHIDGLIAALEPDVTGTIWVGKMNQIHHRVDILSHQDIYAVNTVEDEQSDESIRAIYERHRHNPKLRWKDSVKRVVNLPLARKAGTDE